ncbi:hypothetical protein B0H10DRAFT_2210476 [Mycena sp. CBHHK59/15]|nr:hypothetical protein B0H10DRAFT_2210476 [Mycena sp. CBHHK59/15]
MDPQSPEPRPVPGPYNGGREDAAVSAPRGSALRHLAILSSLMIPIAFLPYLITRRQLTTLRRKVDDMGANAALFRKRQLDANLTQSAQNRSGETLTVGTSTLLAQMRQEIEALRRDVDLKDSEQTTDVLQIHEELDRMRADIVSTRDDQGASQDKSISREKLLETLENSLKKLRHETETSRADLEDQIRLLRGEQEALRSEVFKLSDELQSALTGPSTFEGSELQRLLEEARQTRAMFGAVGSSLGDVATIIQRVKLEMGHERHAYDGYDPVERLRALAMQMQEEASSRGGKRWEGSGPKGDAW